MAEFYLVRHGQASFGEANYDQLSALGQQQAFWLGEYFRERKIAFDHIIIGTQQRHRQTADEICHGAQCTLPYQADAGLNEYDFYALIQALETDPINPVTQPLRDRRSFYIQLKLALQRWAANDLAGPLPERWQDFHERVRLALLNIQRCGHQRVLVVSSGGPIGLLASQVLEAPANTAIELNLQIKNSSFAHFFFNDYATKLAGFNHVPHLDIPSRFDAVTYG